MHFENKGAELMMRTAIQQLKQLDGFKVVLAANPAAPYEKRCEVGAYQYFSLSFGKLDLNSLTYILPKKLTKWLSQTYGIVLESELDTVLDASGYAYGDKWPLRGLERTCNQIKRMFKHNKKYIFMPQMLGPFENPTSQKLIKEAFPKASLVVAREDTSYKCVTDITGKNANTVVGPDFTNLLQVSKMQRDSNRLIVIPNSNMISKRSGHGDWEKRYISIFKDLIEYGLSKGMDVTILNHEDHSDKPICDELASYFPNQITLVQDYDAMQIKTAIAKAGIVVSSRFHGCVSALSQGVTCIGTSWSHKYEELYNDYGASKLLISKPDQEHDYKAYFQSIIDGKMSIEATIAEKGIKIKQESNKTWDIIKEKLLK